MPSRLTIPRIRVDLPDGSSCSLSPSSTLDMKDVLRQAKLLPKLLAEDSVIGTVDDALHLEDGHLQGFRSFPVGRQPPLFILGSHRARLHFPFCPDAFELDDFCRDEEDSSLLVTGPTIPRMKMMMKEPLYVQKWVDSLALDNPPDHIPWTCDKPASATKKKSIVRGSVLLADVLEYHKTSAEQRGAIQEYSCVTSTDKFPAPTDEVFSSRKLRALSEASVPIHASTESHASIPHVRTKSADVDPGVLRGESKTLYTPHRIVTTPQAPSTPTSRSPGPTIGTTSSMPCAPLAARRGKSLSGLELKGHVIEHLEYPDIPTAFRGSPIVWSPRFDTFPVPSFTNHETMLLNLKSKCATLGSGMSAYTQESPRPQTELTRNSSNVDEWAFARGLATFDNSLLESIHSRVPRGIIADTSIFLPDDSSTPVKGSSFTARLGFVPRPHSTPASQSPGNRSSDPPGVPLPPRPALINPSTPPHVRGILKKVKSVRFEDMTDVESEGHTSLIVSSPQTSPKILSSVLAVSSERSCTPMPTMVKVSSGPAAVKETLEKDIQKKSAPRSRLPPKQAKANGRRESAPPNVGNGSEASKPTLGPISAQRPCRIARGKENTNPVAVPRAQARQKGLSIAEIDVRRGIEGTTKSRLSTPLRNIFRFK